MLIDWQLGQWFFIHTLLLKLWNRLEQWTPTPQIQNHIQNNVDLIFQKMLFPANTKKPIKIQYFLTTFINLQTTFDPPFHEVLFFMSSAKRRHISKNIGLRLFSCFTKVITEKKSEELIITILFGGYEKYYFYEDWFDF